MSLTTTLSNVIIKNNTVSVGAQTPDGSNSAVSTLAYDTILSSNADCEILGNTFIGLNAAGNMLSLAGGSHKISQNNFIRKSTSINSYINYTGSNDCMIVDNFFDGYTTNGTSDVLVAGLTVNSVYARNKNQTAYTTTGVNPYGTQIFPADHVQIVFDNFDTSTFAQGLERTNIVNHKTTIATCVANFKVDLNTILPNNVQIISVVYGFYIDGSTPHVNTSGSSSFNMNLIAGVSSNFTYTSLTGSLADAFYQSSAGPDGVDSSTELSATTLNITSPANLTTFISSTQYLKIDVSASIKSQYYITNKNRPVWLNVQYSLDSQGTSDPDTYAGSGPFGLNYVTTQIINSPLIIRYRW